VAALSSPPVAGDQIEFEDVQSGSLNWFFDGTNSPPVLQQALADPSTGHLKGPLLGYNTLYMNTFVAPFNNQLAREALDYCTDRLAITKNVLGGYSVPAYWLGGQGIDYYPGTPKGGKFPYYNFDPAAGQAIVKQLGGLSFQFQVGTSPATQLVPEALSSMWAQNCGINASLEPVATTLAAENHADGQFQIYFQEFGGYTDPAISVGIYSLPTSTSDKWGFDSPTVTNLINESGYSDNPTFLKNLWARIWLLEDKLAVNIPLYLPPSDYFFSKDLHGILFSSNLADFSSAWLG
jgi:peptide/nickel transport system substrate-binding protein